MIDFSLLAKSQEYYTQHGFPRVESPWTVTEEIIQITLPKNVKPLKLIHEDGKCLVGSGEQSFLYLFLKGFLPKGKYQTTTPCFRNDNFNFTHTKYFIKNELIITDEVNSSSLDSIVDISFRFFNMFFKNVQLKITPEGCDINTRINDTIYELGSYGIRQCEFLTWIYGTGLAEPRTSSLIQLQNREA